MKTPISYYGGNQAILGHILPMIPVHEVYTEVFFGGGSVFFAKDPVKNETINDRLDIVVNFYQVLKTDYKNLKPLIDSSLHSRSLHTQALKLIRSKGKRDRVKLAWAFWMCSNFSYSYKIGGGIRYSNHMCSVPPDTMTRKKQDFTELLVERIEHVHIENFDAIKILKSRNVSAAFHLIHPPYVGADQGHYKGYTENDLIDLLDTCSNLNGKFLLNHYNHPAIDHYLNKNGWYKKEVTHRIKAPRKSGPAKCEVLIWNYNMAREKQPTLFEPESFFDFRY